MEKRMTDETITDRLGTLQLAKELLEALTAGMPERSISFALDANLKAVIENMLVLAEERIPKNMQVIRGSLEDILGWIAGQEVNTYVNLNLTEEDQRALIKLLEFVEKDLLHETE